MFTPTTPNLSLHAFPPFTGTKTRQAKTPTAKKVAKGLKGRNAVLLANNGALCVAGSAYDATAVEMVLEKECKTEIGKKLFYAGKPINPIETRLMRFVYLQKYSKQAKK